MTYVRSVMNQMLLCDNNFFMDTTTARVIPVDFYIVELLK